MSKIDSSKLKFRSGTIEDSRWITQTLNTPEVAKFLVTIYPMTEHEVKEFLKEYQKEEDRKYIIAEYKGTPVGHVGVSPSKGRNRHIAWLGIYVQKEWWGRGIGTALMEKAIEVAKAYGCKRLMLGAFEGNERALNLYRKMGFTTEATLTETVCIDGKWCGSVLMGLDLASVKPRISTCQESTFGEEKRGELVVRQLFNGDLDELYRLQNCPESTKSSSRIPPTPKEKTKEWYESLRGEKGIYCLACFEKDELLGYIRYRTSPPPFMTIWTEEFIVDVNAKPYTTADVLLAALKDFKERYGYRKITVDMPVTCVAVTKALRKQGFKKAGIMKAYSYIDEYYVDSAVYAYPKP